MPNLLISGPAGSGKSQLARSELDDADGPAIIADFTSLFNAIRGIERGPDGKFPVRTEADKVYLPIVEYLRRVTISTALERQIKIIGTNSDGDENRRKTLLTALGPAAKEQVIDPGESTVKARLADEITGNLSIECSSAVSRWYGRK